MNPAIFARLAVHSALELAAGCFTVYAVADAWRTRRKSAIVRLVGHPQRFRIAVAFALLPLLLGLVVFGPIFDALPHDETGALPMRTLSFLTALLGGFLFGLSACCIAAPPEADSEFRRNAGFGIAAALILAPPWFGWGGMLGWLVVHPIALVAALVVSHLLLRRNSAAEPPPLPGEGTSRSPALALCIGFAPSFLLLLMFTVASAMPAMGNDVSKPLLIAVCVVSVLCCFVASTMLFRRRTGAAIAGAVVLMLVNGFIALFSGCLAMLADANFH